MDSKSTPLSAKDFRRQGQADLSWVKYASTWRRSHKWLEDNGRDDVLVADVDVASNYDVFEAIKLPLPQVEVFGNEVAARFCCG